MMSRAIAETLLRAEVLRDNDFIPVRPPVVFHSASDVPITAATYVRMVVDAPCGQPRTLPIFVCDELQGTEPIGVHSS